MNLLRVIAGLALLFGTSALRPDSTCAQEINFDQINKFESLGTGTLHVGAPPKTIINDGERHVVVLTIWDADAETKVYWRSPDGNDPRTTIIPGKGIQTFQTAGEFKLSDAGKIMMSIAPTFWAQRFGMLIDKFGIPWMVNCERPPA